MSTFRRVRAIQVLVQVEALVVRVVAQVEALAVRVVAQVAAHTVEPLLLPAATENPVNIHQIKTKTHICIPWQPDDIQKYI